MPNLNCAISCPTLYFLFLKLKLFSGKWSSEGNNNPISGKKEIETIQYLLHFPSIGTKRIWYWSKQEDVRIQLVYFFKKADFPFISVERPKPPRPKAIHLSIHFFQFSKKYLMLVSANHLCLSASFFSSIVIPLSSSLSLSPVPGTDWEKKQ